MVFPHHTTQCDVAMSVADVYQSIHSWPRPGIIVVYRYGIPETKQFFYARRQISRIMWRAIWEASSAIAIVRNFNINWRLFRIISRFPGGSPYGELSSAALLNRNNRDGMSFRPSRRCRGDIPVFADGDKFRATQVCSDTSRFPHRIKFRPQ